MIGECFWSDKAQTVWFLDLFQIERPNTLIHKERVELYVL